MFKDIRVEPPPHEEAIFVDTNVWYWTTYISSKSYVVDEPRDYQTELYPQFIEDALANNSVLYFSPLVLTELATLIENAEFKIYKKYNNDQSINLKRFRRIRAEREGVLKEIKAAFDTIKSMATEIPLDLKDNLSDKLYECMDKYLIDGYDAIFYKKMKANEISNILTDDKDFRAFPIKVYSGYP